MLAATLKNLRARKFRLFTTGFAVLLGVAFVAGTMVLTDTVGRTFDHLFSDVFAGTDAYVRAEEPFEAGDGPGSTRPLIDEAVLEDVRAVDGVAVAEADIVDYAQVIGSDGEAVGNPGQGAPTIGTNWVDDEDLNTFRISQGRPPQADDEVVIDANSADEGGLAVGDRTTILTRTGPVEVTIVGISRFGDVDSPGGASFTAFTTEAAQRFVGQEGKLSGISVVAEDGVSQQELAERIESALARDLETITGAELTEENQDDVQGFIDAFGTFMLVFALIALFVGSFIIYNTFSILVAQRTREMALLRAIGASRRQVTRSLLLEAAVVGLLASLLGLVAGIGLAALLRALLAGFGLDMPSEGLAVEPATIVWSLVLGIGVTVFAAWFPARRGARIPPIAAMRDVAVEHAGRPRLRVASGSTLLLLGVLSLLTGLSSDEADTALPLVGLGALLTILGVAALGPLAARPISGLLGRPVAALRGVSGQLARENAMRNPRRTATTASALMIGVSLVAFITIFASSAKASIDAVFDEQFTGDFVLDTETFGFGGVTPELADDLRGLPELGAVSSLRLTFVELDGDGSELWAMDAAEIGEIADIGLLDGDLAALDDSSLAVLDDRAAERGWEIGTQVPVHFTDTGEKVLTVRAIYENEQLADDYFVDTSVFDANVTSQLDTMIFATLADGVSIEEARPAVQAVTERFPNVKVQDRDEFIERQAGFIDQVVALIYVLLFLAIVIALFGIANTLALSIVERTRELGLLRAVGMTRRQLRTMVRWEAVLIALFGTIGGLGVGIFFGWAMIQALESEGFQVFDVPVARLVAITAIAGLFGVLAAVLPARRASKLNVLHAIAHE